MYITELQLFLALTVVSGIVLGLIIMLHNVESLNIELQDDNFKLNDDLEICQAACQGYEASIQKGINEWDDFTNAELDK